MAAQAHGDPSDRVRNTMRMPLAPGEEVAAPPWQGRADLGAPQQHVVSIDGPVRPSCPEPLKRPARRAPEVPVARAPEPRPVEPRPPEPRLPTREREPARDFAPEPPRRVARGGDDHYHYLPEGGAHTAGSRGRDPHTEPDPGWARQEPPSRRASEPRPPRGGDLDAAFKGGMTIAFPNATSATVDDGSDPDDNGGKYYHPRDRKR